MVRLVSMLAVAFWLLVPATSMACVCNGCGCKGGPGFRGPNGRCVSYKALDKICGSPPTTRCVYEHVKQACEHEGARPDDEGMQKYQRSLGAMQGGRT